ncbi:GNAT family N-acetyltransferase [uncultured Negativibacillus sp.]|uniref:GNAT family N-acetyltransferase n=1 Tax=uncultured Negativibacillus sp. TaxID=1980696 RepID=UPI0025E21250|nr:GNAT family N-acetyltransferase [uncultured Negativibacillus sp.]
MKDCYTTKRLLLRPASISMAAALADYYRRNEAFLRPFEPQREPAFYTEAFQRSILEQEEINASQAQSFRFYLSMREEPEKIIGKIGLNNIVWGCFESCFLGYSLDAEYLRRGLMTEAVNECVHIAFEELGLHRIEANIMPHNQASLGVVRKCGFREEGLAKKYLKINGVWEDHLHMVRLNETEE